MKVMDGSGEETQLRITVKGRRQYTLTKMGFEYGISSGAPTELLGDVSKALAERPWVKDGGYYVLVPEDFSNSMWKGVLEIYPTGKEEEPLMGYTRQFQWKMRTEIHMHCGSLLIMERRGSLRGRSREMINVYLRKM